MRPVILLGASLVACIPALLGCGSESPETASSDVPAAHPATPSILLITLDTMRGDHVGFEMDAVDTPTLDALAARGQVFYRANATAPLTLPAHTSILTGLYPSQHGIHENGRYYANAEALLAPRLRELGYRTAAFVSAFPLAAEFGLDAGFDVYDDELPSERVERTADETTRRALAFLERDDPRPLFLWVHYFDPHEPYEPPEPFLSAFPMDPYLGEIAFTDQQVGHLITAFEDRVAGSPFRILVVGDHGQGLGDHGELLHGNLLYQSVMRVPLIMVGNGIPAGRVDRPVSTRRIFHTVLDWAGDSEVGPGLLHESSELVVAEAFKPFLQYGWQPQVMAIDGSTKVIRSGELEVYDLVADPEESTNLAGQLEIEPRFIEAITTHWDRALEDASSAGALLQQEALERLAALGYVGSTGGSVLREDAPNPKDMVGLFHDLEVGAVFFIRREYKKALPIYQRVLAADPHNAAACLHLAVAHSVLGNEEAALEYFEKARRISPDSIDLQHYLAMHHFRFQQWDEAEPLFEIVLAATPDRLPALECMAQIRERQGRVDEASALLERIADLKGDPVAELLQLGELRMSVGDTPAAIRAYERARTLQGRAFDHDLELGVLYLANRQLDDAALSLDRVSPAHPAYPLALFKRAQVSVLLGEPDREARIQLARDHADDVTIPLIAAEELFQ